MIDGRTELLCLLGNPVGHSLSPRMHNMACDHLNLNMNYMAFKIPRGGLFDAIEGMKALGIRGANVTIPFKEEAIRIVDHVDPLARRVGAINTIVIEDDESYGYNTDVGGIMHAVKQLTPDRDSALILGAGGVARSAVIALDMARFSQIFISNRTKDRADTLRKELDTAIDLRSLPWGRRPEGLSIIVNATSLGMETLWPEELLEVYLGKGHEDTSVLDLVYRRNAETDLVCEARTRGMKAMGGREVLLGQGAEAFELFTGRVAPLEIMRDALREETQI